MSRFGSVGLRTRRAAMIAGAVLIGGAAMPVAAQATTASIQGDVIKIEDTEDENDNITISPSGSSTDGVGWRITNVDVGAGCESSGSGALCNDGRFRDSGAGPTRSFSITLGDGDDELDYGVSDGSSGDSPTGAIDLGEGDDVLDSDATSAHSALGGPGADVLELSGNPSFADPVTMDGGSGDDVLDASGRTTADVFIGGADFDTVSYLARGSSAPVTVTLDDLPNDGRQTSPVEGDDVRSDVEQLIGTPGGDTLTGNGSDQSLDGGPGADTLSGAGGVNTLSFASRSSAVTASLAAGTTTDGDTIAGFANLRGGGGADTLIGNDNANRIEGGPANDTLDGRLGVDELVGEAGTRDLADYGSRPGPVNVSLDGVRSNDPDTDLLDGVEGLRGTAAGDSLRGGSGADQLFGQGGDDELAGGPGAARDELDGGTGAEDLANYAARPTGGFLVTILNTDNGEDDLEGIENVQGGQGSDIIYGDGEDNEIDGGQGDDSIRGGLGADALRGGAGRDTLAYADAARTAGVTVSLDGVANDADGDTTIAGFEVLEGSPFADTLLGGNGADEIVGGSGADTIRGGLGPDVLDGGSNNDLLDGGPGTDPDLLLGNPLDADTADYSARTVPIVVALQESDGEAITVDGDRLVRIRSVIGGTAADRLFGNSLDNELRGGPGNDRIDGLGGNDSLFGEAGDDIIGPLRALPLQTCIPRLSPPGQVCTTNYFRLNPVPDGTDSIDGGSGADLLSSVDGFRDNTLKCGFGFDRAQVDLLDSLRGGLPNVTACESTTRGASDQHPLTRVGSRAARVAADGRVELQVECPRAGPKGCQGTLKLRRGGRTLASTRYHVPRRRSRPVTLQLDDEALRDARRGRGLVVTVITRERDSKDRPLTTRARLRLRPAR